jgi:hypothetical protein
LGIVGIHPAVFVRVENKGVARYGTWKSAEDIERQEPKKEKSKDKLRGAGEGDREWA